MSTETKFLSDGRKVAIIGKLNNTEWIVREIFITGNGDEIPSGESFTTRSIHDQPMESWHKKEEARQKLSVERSKEMVTKIEAEIKRYNNLLLSKKALLANSPELKNLVGEKASLLAAFMTGTIKYLVLYSYNLQKPVLMEDELAYFDSYSGSRFEALKLCSILGNSKGELQFRINHYSDGSGSSAQVFPFETYEEAVQKIKEIASEKIEKGCLSSKDLDVCKELGIEFSDELKDKMFSQFSKSIQNGLDSAVKTLEQTSKNKAELEDQLLNLKKIVGKT